MATVGSPAGRAAAVALDRNRAALAEHQGDAWRRILDGLPAAPCPDVVISATGETVLTLAGPGGRVPLQNASAPRADAERLARLAGADRAETIVLFGHGCGYTLEAVRRLAPADAEIVLVVLDPGAMRAALAVRDLSETYADPRVRVVAGDLPAATAALPRTERKLAVVVDPLLMPAIAPSLAPLADMAAELWGRRVSWVRLAGSVCRNMRSNLDAALDSAPAGKLREIVSGTGVVVAAPGPSLGESLPLLAAHRPPLLVALDTALRPLLGGGVQPDLAVTLDPTESTLGKFDGIDPLPPLVFFDAARPEIVAHASTRAHACERAGLLDRAHPAFGRDGTYSSDGSVLTAAVDLVLGLDAARVILVGADLAPSGTRHHAGESRQDASLELTRTVPGRDGGQLPTTESLWRHRRRLLRRISTEPAGRIVDATAGGALLPGVTREDLGRALAALGPVRPGDVQGRIAASLARRGLDRHERAAARAAALRALDAAESESFPEDS